MSHRSLTAAALILLSLGAGSALAAPSEPSLRDRTSVAEQQLLNSYSFMQAFPDHRWRGRAADAYDAGRYEEAHGHFLQAAHYADKVSQGMLAEMYWRGLGTPVDRAAAYAWMDLAAERGWPYLLGFREHYWQALDEDERARAIDIGKQLYAQYGDDVAKPRMERELRRRSLAATGSRVGADVGTRVYEGDGVNAINSFTPGFELTGFYDRDVRDPQRYWAMLDRAYGKPPRPPRVVVREIEHYKPLPRRKHD